MTTGAACISASPGEGGRAAAAVQMRAKLLRADSRDCLHRGDDPRLCTSPHASRRTARR
jgi:hypothetical protein